MKLIYTVTASDKFDNIKELLKTRWEISDRLLLKLKKENRILLNNKITSVNAIVAISDVIEINLNFAEDNSNIVPQKMNLDILFEDDSLLIVNKPSGIPVHPSMDHYTDSLSNGIKYYFDSIHLQKKIRPINRLDKNTSGIVLFAKNEYIQECLVRQMKSYIFTKEYIAICKGIFKEKTGTINAPINRKPNSIIERCIDENGDTAITHYEVMQEKQIGQNTYSVVKCKLKTGRTHQIRVHMQYIGHSLLGDTLYGLPSPLIDRQALHAYHVHFIHPVTKSPITCIAPIPEDIKKLYSQ